MSLIQTFAPVQISGATLSATLERDDASGQLFVRVVATMSGQTKERRFSIGAEDGKDNLAVMTPAAVQAMIQADLDQARQALAQLLTTEQKVVDAAKGVP